MIIQPGCWLRVTFHRSDTHVHKPLRGPRRKKTGFESSRAKTGSSGSPATQSSMVPVCLLTHTFSLSYNLKFH